METTIDVVRAFFVAQKLVPEANPEALSEDASLLDSGIVDSLNLFKLVSYIEERFHLKILGGDLIPENFETLRTIGNLIETRKSQIS